MTLSSLQISISTILCYSSYFGLIKSNYFCLALHWAFHSIINFGGWILGLLSRVLLSGDVCLAPVSLVNIHRSVSLLASIHCHYFITPPKGWEVLTSDIFRLSCF